MVLTGLKGTIMAGGPNGAKWPKLSEPQQYRRLDMWFNGRDVSLKRKTNSGPIQLSRTALRRAGRPEGRFSLLGWGGERKAHRYWARSGRLQDSRQSIPDARLRWKTPSGGHSPKNSGLRNDVAMSSHILRNLAYKNTGSLRYDIGALTPLIAEYLGKVQAGKTTAITRKMRRSFWAAGVPLGKDTNVIYMPPRPLIDPVFKKMRPDFEKILVDRIRGYLEGTITYV
jgi:hypothetical protein